MTIPPGILYLAPTLPYLLAPAVVLYAASNAIKFLLSITVPNWLLVTAYVLLWPLLVIVQAHWYQYQIERRANAAGAELPPMVEAKLPGGIDLVRKAAKDWTTHFNGYRLMEWVAQYGYTYNFRALLQNRIFTAEPEYIKRILATDFNSFEKGPEFNVQMKTLLGTGVFNSDGDMWKFHRAMTRPFFSRDRISHFDVFDRHAEKVISSIRERIQEGQPIDWQDLISRFTLDSATEFLFGKDLCSLSAGLPYPPNTPMARDHSHDSDLANRFARAFLQAQELSAKRSRYTKAWPLMEFWSNKVDEHVKVMDEFIGPLLQEALKNKPKHMHTDEKDKEVGDDETLLGHLVKLTDDPQIIRDETLNILLAGRDTTALLLTMCVYMLSQHPDVLKRLREEIISKVGSRRPTFEDIKEMKYLRAFINEVLRLYPSVPFNVRYSAKDSIWPSTTPGGKPFFIPAHTRCLYSVSIMHRRRDLWGPDALEFDPDRFIDERVSKYLTPNPFIFLPFNAGPRICLGQQFAYSEASFMLIRLLQQVTEVKLVQEVNPAAVPPPGWAESKFSNGKDCVQIRSHLTMYVEGGLWVEMKTTGNDSEIA